MQIKLLLLIAFEFVAANIVVVGSLSGHLYRRMSFGWNLNLFTL